MGIALNGLGVAVSFLTRVPVRADVRDVRDIARSVPWFPWVGGALGAAVAGVFIGAGRILPPLVAAALAVVAATLATGAFHEDALGDVADGFAGGATPARRIEIMRDPRLGTFGVLAVASALVVRIATIASLDALPALTLLPSAHALSRGASVAMMRLLRPAANGLGADYVGALDRGLTAAALVSALVISSALMGVWTVPGVALCTLAVASMRAVAQAKIGGLTGDVLGATEQICELTLLILGAAIVHEGWGGLPPW